MLITVGLNCSASTLSTNSGEIAKRNQRHIVGLEDFDGRWATEVKLSIYAHMSI